MYDGKSVVVTILDLKRFRNHGCPDLDLVRPDQLFSCITNGQAKSNQLMLFPLARELYEKYV